MDVFIVLANGNWFVLCVLPIQPSSLIPQRHGWISINPLGQCIESFHVSKGVRIADVRFPNRPYRTGIFRHAFETQPPIRLRCARPTRSRRRSFDTRSLTKNADFSCSSATTVRISLVVAVNARNCFGARGRTDSKSVSFNYTTRRPLSPRVWPRGRVPWARRPRNDKSVAPIVDQKYTIYIPHEWPFERNAFVTRIGGVLDLCAQATFTEFRHFHERRSTVRTVES